MSCWTCPECLFIIIIITIVSSIAILAQEQSWLKSFLTVSLCYVNGLGVERRGQWLEDEAASDVRKSRGGQRAAARSQQSSSTRSQRSSYTPPTSSEREREAPGKPKSQRSSTACSTPSCKGFVFNDRIDSEPHCRYCGQAFNATTSPHHSNPDRQEFLALATRLRAMGDEHTALRLEEIAPAPEQSQPNATSPSRLLKSLECRKKYGCAEDESACVDGGQGGSLDGGA